MVYYDYIVVCYYSNGVCAAFYNSFIQILCTVVGKYFAGFSPSTMSCRNRVTATAVTSRPRSRRDGAIDKRSRADARWSDGAVEVADSGEWAR